VTSSALAVAAGVYLVKLFLLAVGVTLVEVTNAKLRLFRVPELMAASLGLAFLALAIRFL
jgi:formate hydrogenlyase subunit 4